MRSRPSRAGRAWWSRARFALPLLLVLASCSAAVQESPLVVSSDPELRRLGSELLPGLARRSGLELQRPVRIERRSRSELVRYLTARLDEELPAALAQSLALSYTLLGLLPEGLDLRELLLSVYTEQVAGFYDPDSVALFVLDDQPASTLRTVLVHELVHALQDQAAPLDSLTARERGNDRQTAAQAAIEGHATLVMLEHVMSEMQGSDADLSTVEGFAESLRPALEGVGGQYPALAEAPRIVRETLLFPYLEGAAYVHRLWRERPGRPSPFGPYLPQSTEQILRPELVLAAGRAPPPVEVEVGVRGHRVLHSDVLGRLEAGLLLEELSGDPSAGGAAEGWAGDRYVLVEAPGGSGLVWVSVWESSRVRDRFHARLEAVRERLPGTATVEAALVDGLPAVVLRVGVEAPVEARARPGAAP